jgi:hypothetical protein
MRRTTFLISLLIFLALNLVVLPQCKFDFDRFAYAYRSWPWWLVQDLRTASDKFNIALLGSSLMLSPIGECDANFSGRNIDATTHHRSLYFDNRLATAFGGAFRTFNLATPGQMPSDACLLARTIAEFGQQPRLYVYGIAPRDFLDSRLASPADTEPYRYLKRILPVNELAYDGSVHPLAALEQLLSHTVFLYQHAIEMQLGFARQIELLLALIVPAPQGVSPFTYWDRVALLPNYKAGELYPGAFVNSPVSWSSHPGWKRDNIEDYLERYRRPNQQTFHAQVVFLNRLISLCHDQGAEIVLVNMPLSKLNMNLLGQTRYQNFVAEMKTISLARGVKLIDLGQTPDQTTTFGNEYFEDSAHLNGFGGKRLLDSITSSMKQDRELSRFVRSVGESGGEPKALASRGRPGAELR